MMHTHTATGDVLDVPLIKPRLKANAVPRIFPGYPKYNVKEESSRESPTTKRRRIENLAIRQAIEDSIKSADLHSREQSLLSLDDIVEKFKNKNFPSWTLTRTNNQVCFIQVLEKPHNVQAVTKYIAAIGADMQMKLFFKDEEFKCLTIAPETIKFPTSIHSCHFLETMLIKIGDHLIPETSSNKITKVVEILDSLIEEIPEKCSSITFLKEQISLLQHHNKRSGIRYSWETLLFCSIFNAVSPHAYKFTRNYNILILPSTNTVKKICNNSLTDPRMEQSEEGCMKYMKLKFPLLSEKDKLVTLMVDEVHLKPYIDYKGGNLVGEAFNSEARATSACTFMISSLMSTYKDVVHVAPVKVWVYDMPHTRY